MSSAYPHPMNCEFVLGAQKFQMHYMATVKHGNKKMGMEMETWKDLHSHTAIFAFLNNLTMAITLPSIKWRESWCREYMSTFLIEWYYWDSWWILFKTEMAHLQVCLLSSIAKYKVIYLHELVGKCRGHK